MPKKSPLDLLIAIGKGSPKSANPEGVMGDSTTAPDQGESGMDMGAPVPMVEEEVSEPMPNSIILPKGFKLPDGVEDGAEFTTTVRGKKMGDHLMVEAIGDMPLDGEASETMEDETAESPDEQETEASEGTEQDLDAMMAENYKKKKADSEKARNVFKS